MVILLTASAWTGDHGCPARESWLSSSRLPSLARSAIRNRPAMRTPGARPAHPTRSSRACLVSWSCSTGLATDDGRTTTPGHAFSVRLEGARSIAKSGVSLSGCWGFSGHGARGLRRCQSIPRTSAPPGFPWGRL